MSRDGGALGICRRGGGELKRGGEERGVE